MKTITRNTTQPRSQTMREVTSHYRPTKHIKWFVKLHNASYHIQRAFIWAEKRNVILAVLMILFVAAFVVIAFPAVAGNIVRDILAKR